MSRPEPGFLPGLLIVTGIVIMVAIALWQWHHPEVHTPAMGAFHCDPSLHLPCDGAR